jgi:hypothetical protein
MLDEGAVCMFGSSRSVVRAEHMHTTTANQREQKTKRRRAAGHVGLSAVRPVRGLRVTTMGSASSGTGGAVSANRTLWALSRGRSGQRAYKALRTVSALSRVAGLTAAACSSAASHTSTWQAALWGPEEGGGAEAWALMSSMCLLISNRLSGRRPPASSASAVLGMGGRRTSGSDRMLGGWVSRGSLEPAHCEAGQDGTTWRTHQGDASSTLHAGCRRGQGTA